MSSDVEKTLKSVVVATRFITEALIPSLVLLNAVLWLIGLKTPKFPIFHDFIEEETIKSVEAEEAAERQTMAASESATDADFSNPSTGPTHQESPRSSRKWLRAILTGAATFELTASVFVLVKKATEQPTDILRLVVCSIGLLSWLYAALRPGLFPSPTVYYDLLVLYSCLLAKNYVCFFQLGLTRAAACELVVGIFGTSAIVTMPLRVMDEPIELSRDRYNVSEDSCTLIEWITFSWISPLISIGESRALEESDVWSMSREMRSRAILKQFMQIGKQPLWRSLIIANAKDLFIDFVMTVSYAVLGFAPPIILNLMLRALNENQVSKSITPKLEIYATSTIDAFLTLGSGPLMLPQEPRNIRGSDLYFLAITAFFCRIVQSQAQVQYLYFSRRASLRIKSEIVGLIYRKSLTRKNTLGATPNNQKGKAKDGETSQSAGTGEIVSLVAADAESISQFTTMGYAFYEAPLNTVIACVLLYNLMGWSAFAGYAVLVAMFPIKTYLVRRASNLQKSASQARDARMSKTNEMLQSIKFIKFSAWESHWMNRILALRSAELGWLRRLKITAFLMDLLWSQGLVFVSAIAFTCFTVIERRELRVEIAFPAIAILEILSRNLGLLPSIMNSIVRTATSLERINKYLAEEDVPDFVSSLNKCSGNVSALFDSRLGFKSADFRWPGAHPSSNVSIESTRLPCPPEPLLSAPAAREVADLNLGLELRDISVIFPEGRLSVIFGPTGSGKSSLLAAVLGEMECLKGDVYLPKEPTRLNKETGLRSAVSYCAQQPWLEHKSIRSNILFGFPYDQARYESVLQACALGPDIDMLDGGDETEIGERGVTLSGGQKVRVALARAVYSPTQIVILDDIFSAVDSHTAKHIMHYCLSGPLMERRTILLATHHVQLVLDMAGWLVELDKGRVVSQGTREEIRESGSVHAEHTSGYDRMVAAGRTESGAAKANREHRVLKKLTEAENRSTGSVKHRVYHTYLSATSYWLFGLVLLLLASNQLVQIAQKFWLKRWSDTYESARNKKSHLIHPSKTSGLTTYLLVYLGLQAVQSFTKALSQLPAIVLVLRASKALHERILRSVVRSTILRSCKLETVPQPPIPDINVVDNDLQDYLSRLLSQIPATIFSLMTMTYVVPSFMIPAVIVTFVHIRVLSGYANVSRDLRRMESNARSPVVSSFTEMVHGVVTIRAFGVEHRFLSRMHEQLDHAHTASHYYRMCNRWLLTRFDVLGAFSVLLVTLGAIRAGASAGLMGVVVVQAQVFVDNLYWGLRSWIDLEQAFNSVERIQEYLDLPSEPPSEITASQPPAGWLSKSSGTIAFHNVTIKYAPELDPALDNISFSIKTSEKIGIVGRTGSGKSTLGLSLFRFVDPFAGSIVLDDIDITTIGLGDLRSHLTLIPQDVALFKGTVRENLDPLEEHTDVDCFRALRQVHLLAGAVFLLPTFTFS
ncbi:ABC transporter [Ceratobasidium sp. AG-Ba]|nr:ABC transporter [Ceratobasidium sp. AG-Ba]